MALVRTLEAVPLRQNSVHTEVNCTYDVVCDANGRKYLQLDTYGSKTREIKGKKSQSLRLAPEALQQLKRILTENNL